MKEETRYRVTGSLFLLALAVICLPMLLDGAGVPARELPDVELPAPPAGTTAVPGAAASEPAEAPPLPEGPGAGASPSARSDLVARIEALREQVDPEGYMPDGTRFGEPVLSPEQADTEVWAIQVASFARGGNAEGFRDRLRQDGYEAFISTVKADDQVLRRVAVGPMLDRERADSLRGELSTRYDVQARLMQFSN